MNEETAVHSERKNRTVICTVLFADIVKFSERGVADQTAIKENFNELVGEAVVNIAPVDRMVLDTGDGVALCLFGDPEEGMFLALALRDGFSRERPASVPDYLVRIGLNLGPIKVVTDLNGQFNAIGDGINVAQRVMNFAEPGQVLCARSYYEIVSRLSDDFSRLFEFIGVRHDKHVREHDVYEVRSPMSTPTSGFDMPVVIDRVETPSAPVLPDETIEQLTAMLARFEGPMAKVLVRKAAANVASAEELVERIAGQMHDKDEAATFKKAAQALTRQR